MQPVNIDAVAKSNAAAEIRIIRYFYASPLSGHSVNKKSPASTLEWIGVGRRLTAVTIKNKLGKED